MRIGMVSATYDPAVLNGVVRMVALYKRHLESRGHEVVIFTLGESQPDDEAQGVFRSPGIRLGEYGYYLGIGYTREAQASLSQMDIVHSHHLFMSVEMAHRYARCPIVYTNHTRYDLYTGAYTSLPQSAADAIMRQVWPDFTDLADVVIAPSNSVRRVMLDFGVRSPIEVIENGIELERYQRPAAPMTKSDLGLPEASPLLMFVGRLSSEKSVDVLLRSFAAARRRRPDLRLAVVGKGPESEALVRLAAELGLADSVLFTGAVPFDAIPDHLAAADAFVTASTSEVHPLTVIEAMAARRPVVAIAAAGIVDTVVNGETGYLAEDGEGLAEAIVALVADPARADRMGQAAGQASQRYDIRRTVDLTEALYARLLAERPDLNRVREHGRWSRRTERWAPLLEQLSGLLSPPERRDAANGGARG
jgi:glycosyltransferase involved in cell wall biosynthesis